MKHYLIAKYSLDVCQSNGNLLVSGCGDRTIKIFDKRKSTFVQTFDGISKQGMFFFLFNRLFLSSNCYHLGSVNCVRWSPSGDMLAFASAAPALLDFNDWKIDLYWRNSKTP